MDINVFGSYSGIVSAILIIGGAIYAAVNHRRCRSKCCGRTLEASVDIDHTHVPSPTGIIIRKPEIKIDVPEKV